MKRLILLAPIALAACNQGPSVTATNASAGEVAAKVEAATGGAAFVSPGQWKGTMTVSDVQIPGAPPAMAEQMKKGMGEPHSFVTCLTPEDVQKPKEKFFGDAAAGDCRYNRFTMAGGTIDAEMTCAQSGQERTTKMTGSYSPNAYKMVVQSTGKAAPGNPVSGMTMTMAIDSQRTGACTGEEED
ncbi:DUF3617 domain-containing protein [Sphingomonas sp.]|uniref:DUF3617 domain-containing protein n=1 Tax=Sphingomonas sp. TaxID=28214 RepID=UPI002BF5DE95|nr:DUF3617 domain-containing protein [Sphingomonas sp.]HWK35284.1 DUF3617 domain-containing protein [Sphingomonas sp.]